MKQFSFTGKEGKVLLKKLETRHWGIGELHQTVLTVPNAQILYQLEREPWHRTIIYTGKEATYRIKLPRVKIIDDSIIPWRTIAVYGTDRSPAARREVIGFLEKLASTS